MNVVLNACVDILPEPDPIDSECNEYYLVKVKRFGWDRAMYLTDGVSDGWYTKYSTKLIVEVTHWAELPMI